MTDNGRKHFPGEPRHRNVRFSLEQLEELRYITRAYLKTEGPAYIHALEDFHDWLSSHVNGVILELKAEGLREPGSESVILPPKKTCSLCAGDPNNTPGGCRCKECMMVGTQPWGG